MKVIDEEPTEETWDIVYDSLDKNKKVSPPSDAVNHPSHYNAGKKIEVIDFIDDQNMNFSIGNCVKYLARAPHKGTHLEDLKKARFYLEYEIRKLERELSDER